MAVEDRVVDKGCYRYFEWYYQDSLGSARGRRVHLGSNPGGSMVFMVIYVSYQMTHIQFHITVCSLAATCNMMIFFNHCVLLMINITLPGGNCLHERGRNQNIN